MLPRRRLRDGAVDVLAGEEDPISVPLALSTRVVGVEERHHDLVDALAELAGDQAEVAEIDGYEYLDDDAWDAVRAHQGEAVGVGPADPVGPTVAVRPTAPVSEDLVGVPERISFGARQTMAHAITVVSDRWARLREPAAEPTTRSTYVGDAPAPMPSGLTIASPTPSPLRDPVVAVRADLRTDFVVHGANALDLDDDDTTTRRELPEARELRRLGSVDLVEDTVLWGERVAPIAREGDAVEPLVIDDLAAEPAPDPVVGPELTAARSRLGLSIDQLAERTRIRPHVIESMEVDDFAPCGGDFYARGHLRTLARVLGIDATPLLSEYDERYADAPINPRRVFEAELGAGGAIRGTRGGPNWSVLIAAVMALVLAWSIARLVMDSPVDLRDPVTLTGSGSRAGAGAEIPVVLTAAGGGAQVVVRDGDNQLVYKGALSFGQSKVIKSVSQPVHIQSSDGSLEVTIDGDARGALGTTGNPAQNTFVAN
ncbi:unannotated protein [freshwater metagenome]|uniref:Unannotated protein n=1 Tax=freshwater metagenome TaxID=449393 RepID=A0A6J6RLI8_9ZZZZ